MTEADLERLPIMDWDACAHAIERLKVNYVKGYIDDIDFELAVQEVLERPDREREQRARLQTLIDDDIERTMKDLYTGPIVEMLYAPTLIIENTEAP